MGLLEKLNDVFFPKGIKCVVCGRDIPENSRYPVCEHCVLEKNTEFCLTCGRNMSIGSRYCTDCKNRDVSFRIARAPFVYRDNVKLLIHRMKYGNGKYLAEEMSIYLADAYYEHGLMSDIITFVPMFYKKQRKRGYNQAEELAKALGKKVDCNTERLLMRTHETPSNACQNARQREQSVSGTIAISDHGANIASEVKGKRILLVDDVFTTGVTSRECAKILIKAKAAEVNVLTLATARQSDVPKQTKVTKPQNINTHDL